LIVDDLDRLVAIPDSKLSIVNPEGWKESDSQTNFSVLTYYADIFVSKCVLQFTDFYN